MKNKLMFVYNPCSGKSRIKNKLGSIVEIFAKRDWDINVHPTKSTGDAIEITAEAGKEYDYIIVGGGDGTLNEAVSGIMTIPLENRPPIGYIPTGTTNDFATSFGIPKIIEKAAELSMTGKPKKCDVGSFNDRHFLYVAAFGAFTEVTYETSQKIKSMFGYAAYLMEGIKSLPAIKHKHMKIKYNDGLETEGDYILGIISNSTSVAGMRYSKKFEVSMNDGEFECILVKRPSNTIDFQLAFKDLLMQNIKSARLEYFKFSKAEIETEENVKWTLDGEFGGEHNRVIIENLRSAISIVARDT